QLVSIYASAYKMTGKDLYRQRIVETLDFIKKNLTNELGGFYSSLNADSEGEEGKFYVWHQNEIDSLLSPEEAEVFNEFYHVMETGNWEEEKNILFTREDMETYAQNSGKNAEEIQATLTSSKQKLFDARSQRIKPSLDDKVLTSWNALMLKGYADAFAALGEESYREAAVKNGNFILENMMDKDGRLDRNYKNGKTSINAFAVDYALTIQAFISLYQITFEESWLDEADKLTQYALAHFFDKKSGMFNYTSDLDKELIVRKVEITDGVIPGSNSIMAKNLFELGTLLYKEEYIEKAKQMLAGMEEKVHENGGSIFYTDWCSLYLDMLHPPYEVAIVGEDYAKKRDDLLKNYLPNALLLGGAQEGNLELLKDKLQEGETMIYVCMNKVCKLPVTEVEDALGLLE
ncbi:MAG: thioredoxin domain-containing protein, partial [Bacteroidetes bacterium]